MLFILIAMGVALLSCHITITERFSAPRVTFVGSSDVKIYGEPEEPTVIVSEPTR